MANTDIFLGSGASITFVPENDIYFGTTTTNAAAGSASVPIVVESSFSNKFDLITDLYVGCLLEMRLLSDESLVTTHRITSNTNTSFQCSPTANVNSSNHYFVIKSYGAPCPAPKATVSSGSGVSAVSLTTPGTQHLASQTIIDPNAVSGISSGSNGEILLTLSSHSSALTFVAADADGANYGTGFITIQTATPSGDSPIGIVFDTDDQTTNNGSTFDEFVEVTIADGATAVNIAQSVTTALNTLSQVTASRVGAKVTVTNVVGGYVGSGTMITKGGGDSGADYATISDDVDGGIITAVSINTAGTGYSGTTHSHTITTGGTNGVISVTVGTTTAAKRLLSDQWLGILESATFPTTEVEMKRTNLSLGGSRNFTYQYKGITSHSGGSLGLVANHGAFLYYFLGKCTQIECDTAAVSGTPTSFLTNASDKGKIFLEGDNSETPGAGVTTTDLPETGPLFIRSIDDGADGVLCPPISPHLITLGDMVTLDRPVTSAATITKPITYTFAEQDGDLLPSFALEQNLSKLATSSNKYRTNSANADEDLNFVKIARGNRVGDISITANENEEVKMTLNLFTRNIHTPAKTEVYDARRAVESETFFFNYETSSNGDNAREPFFFSDGTFSVLGNNFLKINSLTLNMNNNLQDRRFLGVGNKNVQEAIPAQREYEISFTGHVTDNALYNALLEDAEETSQTISLTFRKANGEEINLTFTDYFVTANNFPIPDDKGPLVVEATVLPRNLGTCTVKTHWILQG
tara:strand:+ start:72 stop:2330 length:2259 start_codon:yes stop_codon:yes gene_type:complete